MISVIIPAYNAASTLAETLISVKDQTLNPSEVVIVDDGSTDHTAEIAIQYGFKIIRHPSNKGVSSAINTGLAATSEPLIAILDADDLWYNKKLEIQKSILENSDMAIGQVQEFIDPSEDPSKFIIRSIQVGWLYGACLIKRSVFNKIGTLDEILRTGAWVDWMARVRHSDIKTTIHKDVVLRRRLRHNSLSSTDRTQDLLQIARLSIQRKRHVRL